MKWPVELLGDFQQFYGLNFHKAGIDYSYEYAADLAATLPNDSRIAKAANPALEWSVSDYMLANIEYNTAWLAWSRSKDGQRNSNKPKRRKTPLELADVRSKLDETDISEIDAILGYA